GRRCWRSVEGGQGRPQAARRESLDGPVSCCRDNGIPSPLRTWWVRRPGRRAALWAPGATVVDLKQAELGWWPTASGRQLAAITAYCRGAATSPSSDRLLPLICRRVRSCSTGI